MPANDGLLSQGVSATKTLHCRRFQRAVRRGSPSLVRLKQNEGFRLCLGVTKDGATVEIPAEGSRSGWLPIPCLPIHCVYGQARVKDDTVN